MDGAIQTPKINETKDEVVCSKPFCREAPACPGYTTQEPSVDVASWVIHSRESRALKPIWEGPGKETRADSMMCLKGMTLIPMGGHAHPDQFGKGRMSPV